MSRLKEHLKALPDEEEMVSLPYKVKAIGQIECLALTVGAVPVECAALVVGECVCAALGAGWGSAPACPRGESTTDRNVAFLQQKPPFGPSDGGREGGREDVCSRAVLVAPGLLSCSTVFPAAVTRSLYKQGFIYQSSREGAEDGVADKSRRRTF